MLVTEISLCEFYREIRLRAESKNYVWIVSLIARYADAEEMYVKLERDWASLHDLTNDKILFVFSANVIQKNNSFFHIQGQENYIGKMCPFAEMLNGEDIRDNQGDFSRLYNNFNKVDWKQKHSLAITEFAREYGISEEQIPAIFIWNLEMDMYEVIPLENDDDLYKIMKRIIKGLEEVKSKDTELEQKLSDYSRISRYFSLYDELIKRAKRMNKLQKDAVLDVLNGKCTYLERKQEIEVPQMRKDLKRIGQWKKQIFDGSDDLIKVKMEYDEILIQKQNLLEQKERLWKEMFYEYRKGRGEKKDNCIPEKHEIIIRALLEICVRMQGNSNYYGVDEDYRNDYIRDMLSLMNFDVKDQTRQGLSKNEKKPGELDLLICEKGLPMTIIEALNLYSFNKRYIDEHIERIYKYDGAGNRFNILLSYVTVANFPAFIRTYKDHIKNHAYSYPLDKVEECKIEEISYTDLVLIKSVYNRNACACVLYHVCVLIR